MGSFAGTTIRGLSMHEPSSYGFVVGDGGLVCQTVDGGATWKPLASTR